MHHEAVSLDLGNLANPWTYSHLKNWMRFLRDGMPMVTVRLSNLASGHAAVRAYSEGHQSETHCIILFRLDPRQETPWPSQHTKNSKQNSRKWKSREADAAAARWSSASAKKGA